VAKKSTYPKLNNEPQMEIPDLRGHLSGNLEDKIEIPDHKVSKEEICGADPATAAYAAVSQYGKSPQKKLKATWAKAPESLSANPKLRGYGSVKQELQEEDCVQAAGMFISSRMPSNGGDESAPLFHHSNRGNVPDIHDVMAETSGEEDSPLETFTYSTEDDCEKSIPIPSSCATGLDHPMIADRGSALPADPEDVALIRGQMVVERVNERLHIYVIAVDMQTPANNSIQSISAEGESLGGYAYEAGKDVYLINCKSHMSLGSVSAAYRVSMPGHGSKYLLPLPEMLVEKHLPPNQKKQLRAFREKYKGSRYLIQFVQSVCGR